MILASELQADDEEDTGNEDANDGLESLASGSIHGG